MQVTVHGVAESLTGLSDQHFDQFYGVWSPTQGLLGDGAAEGAGLVSGEVLVVDTAPLPLDSETLSDLRRVLRASL